jgi:hypothetical protein
MNDLSTAMAVLSAMITPAVLISACASLILTTSQRLGRVIDRTRRISTRLQELAQTQMEGELLEEEHILLFYASLLLIAESRVALAAVNDEWILFYALADIALQRSYKN